MVRILRQDVKRLSELRKRRQYFRLAGVGVALVLLIGAASFVFASDSMKIHEVKILGADNVPQEEVLKIVKEEISGNYAFIIPKKNIIFYPRLSIKDKINSEFVRVGKITTDVRGGDLEVKLSEREEKYIWCPTDVYEKRKRGSGVSGCFYIDESALIFKSAPIFREGTFLELVTTVPTSEDGNYIGARAIDENLFGKILSVIKEVNSPSFSIIRVLMKDDGDIVLTTNKNWDILIAGTNELNRVVRNLNLALASDALKAEVIDAKGGLEYLDLRFGNKVFFKFKNQ